MQKHIDDNTVHILKRSTRGIIIYLTCIVALSRLRVTYIQESFVLHRKYTRSVFYEFLGRK